MVVPEITHGLPQVVFVRRTEDLSRGRRSTDILLVCANIKVSLTYAIVSRCSRSDRFVAKTANVGSMWSGVEATLQGKRHRHEGHHEQQHGRPAERESAGGKRSMSVQDGGVADAAAAQQQREASP